MNSPNRKLSLFLHLQVHESICQRDNVVFESDAGLSCAVAPQFIPDESNRLQFMDKETKASTNNTLCIDNTNESITPLERIQLQQSNCKRVRVIVQRLSHKDIANLITQVEQQKLDYNFDSLAKQSNANEEQEFGKQSVEKNRKAILKREMMKKANVDRVNEVTIAFFKRLDDKIRKDLKDKKYNNAELFWIAVKMGQTYLNTNSLKLCQIVGVDRKLLYRVTNIDKSQMESEFKDNKEMLEKFDLEFFKRPKKYVVNYFRQSNLSKNLRKLIVQYINTNYCISVNRICELFNIRTKTVICHIKKNSKMEQFDNLSPAEYNCSAISMTYFERYATNLSEVNDIIERKKTKLK